MGKGQNSGVTLGYGVSLDPAGDRRAQRDAIQAAAFRVSPYWEGLIELLGKHPDMELSPTTRMALHMYRTDKARAEKAVRQDIGKANEGGE